MLKRIYDWIIKVTTSTFPTWESIEAADKRAEALRVSNEAHLEEIKDLKKVNADQKSQLDMLVSLMANIRHLTEFPEVIEKARLDEAKDQPNKTLPDDMKRFHDDFWIPLSDHPVWLPSLSDNPPKEEKK